MHPEAMEWVARYAPACEVDAVLDIGGRDNNGSPRGMFTTPSYVVLDVVDGPDVDIVDDAATWTPDRAYDVVVCTEVFEHTPDWPSICMTAFKALREGGMFIATMAGPNRPAHGAWGDPGPRPGEWYHNIVPENLLHILDGIGFLDITIEERATPSDVRVVAHR